LSDIRASSTAHCQPLVLDKGIPNTVQCAVSDPLMWFIDGTMINATDSTYRKMFVAKFGKFLRILIIYKKGTFQTIAILSYGYIPNGGQLYIYHPKHNQIVNCSRNSISYCYHIILRQCHPDVCKNNGRCKLVDSNTPLERVTCICKHLSKGYRCDEKYESMIWVTVLLWLAVFFEIAMITGAIYRAE
uniref:EGF-like domain-containing protein n=1 Tax=Onchocerca flexuosa TaxID=387005 RepID=A0A183H7H6_9BILA